MARKSDVAETTKEEPQTIRVDPVLGRGAYANLAIVRRIAIQSSPVQSSPVVEEFLIDFVLRTGTEEPQLVSRVIMSPQHAARLARVLTANTAGIPVAGNQDAPKSPTRANGRAKKRKTNPSF